MQTPFVQSLRALHRASILVVLMFAVLFPKVSGAVMELVPSIQTMIICTGGEVIVIRLDSNGTRVEEQELNSDQCLIDEKAIIANAYEPAWHQLARSYHHVFAVKLNASATADRLTEKRASRGPPVLT